MIQGLSFAFQFFLICCFSTRSYSFLSSRFCHSHEPVVPSNLVVFRCIALIWVLNSGPTVHASSIIPYSLTLWKPLTNPVTKLLPAGAPVNVQSCVPLLRVHWNIGLSFFASSIRGFRSVALRYGISGVLVPLHASFFKCCVRLVFFVNFGRTFST